MENTLQTESITIQIDNDGVFIYDSMRLISQANVLGTNGFIHIVVDIASSIDSSIAVFSNCC